MKFDSHEKLSSLTLALHWIVAIVMISLLAIGVYMVETETRSLYSWHKSFGLLILFIAVIRVVWRIRNGWPTPVGNYSNFEHLLSTIVHWALIIGTIVLPISGFLMSSLGGNGVDLFGLEIIARNIDPENPAKTITHSEALASFFHNIHYWSSYIIIATVILHVAGALKHHIIDKDETLTRMLK
ncbi:cytochrome B561 [Shewanella psychrophila]|uniref:Cytochrome B561 n=1 Tax=Shewanella psychrophila TaxID=225848 RepID=A0A1S6HLM6_9GAMM|nr:cytochrome b [Shewanella psychrophila]AQS36436.1 cytochrome B561 [Shewanella psychrophila]